MKSSKKTLTQKEEVKNCKAEKRSAKMKEEQGY